MKRLLFACIGVCCLFVGTSSAQVSQRIGVDPGHGGTDFGASGPTGLTEKQVNLSTALALKAYLEADGATVFITRTSDATVSLSTRTNYLISNAVSRIVSVHHNSGGSSTNVTMDFVYCGRCFSTAGNLASSVIQRVSSTSGRAIGTPSSTALCAGRTDYLCGRSGVGQANLQMVRYPETSSSQIPSVLVEVSFISNQAEETRLRNADYLDGNGWAIYAGVAEHFGKVPKPRSIFSDTVEGGNIGWTSTGSGLWHVTARRGNSPTHSWWYGRESSGTYDLPGQTHTGSLESPSFQLNSDSTLSFQSWYQTEDGGTAWDIKMVEISINGGAWQFLNQISGTSRAWIAKTISLASFRGSARVRFRFNTIDSLNNNFEGWYVDDIKVNSTGGSSPPPPPPPQTAPDLIVSSLSGPSSGTAGGQVNVSVSIRNQGNGGAGQFRVGFYYSTNSAITTSDTFSGSYCNYSGLGAGLSGSCSGNIGVPASLPPGVYYLGAIADYQNAVAESNEGNNSRASGPMTISGTTNPIAWEFNTSANFLGWNAFNISAASVNNGALFIDPAGNDPHVDGPSIAANASVYRYVVLRLASNALDGSGNVYFRTQAENFYSETKRISFTVSNCHLCGNAPFLSYSINLGSHPKWTGTITGIRIDPANNGQPSTNIDTVGFDYIRLTPTP